jgi:hypothetical protein
MANQGRARRPRSTGEVLRSSIDELHARQRRRAMFRLLFTLALLGFLVWGANVTLAGKPVRRALAEDRQASGLSLAGRLGFYVDPTTLVLDLRRPELADTDQVLRAALLPRHELVFPDLVRRVVLARAGSAVFEVGGDDYRRLSVMLERGTNPVVVLRGLVAALRLPGGAPAPPLDLNAAARFWVTGSP